MKKLLILIVLLISVQSQSQTYIKLNAVTTLLTVPNIAIETSIGKKTTFQVDILASFWNSIDGLPYKLMTITPEFRYHFNEKFNGFYTGVHVGGSIYKMSKGVHIQYDQYEEGFGYMIGTTLGYQRKIRKNIMLDFFLGGGFHQGFYKGYYAKTGERYDGAKDYNKSGEWIPYRGGIMVSYQIN
jgi:hypothetical protein